MNGSVYRYESEVDERPASPARARDRAPSNPQGGLTTPTDSARHPDAVCVFSRVFKIGAIEYICGNCCRYRQGSGTGRKFEWLTGVQNGGAC